MDTPTETLDMRYAGLSLAELKAQALEREHAAEQLGRVNEQAERLAAEQRWRDLLDCAKSDLHPELFARIEVERPEEFTLSTNGWALKVKLPYHSALSVTYYYNSAQGWHRAVNANYHKAWFDVAVYTIEYGEGGRYVRQSQQFVLDLGNALLLAEREYQNGLALQTEVDKENAERAAARPEPTLDEILLDALKEWVRSQLPGEY